MAPYSILNKKGLSVFTSAWIGIFIALNSATYAQFSDTLRYSGEMLFTIPEAEENPFWLLSNQYGTISPRNNNYILRASLFANGAVGDHSDYFAGVDAINRYSGHNKAWLQQAYAGFRFGFLKLKGGLWEQTIGNHDPILGSGGMIWSGNARPMPQMSLEFNKYENVPFTGGWLEFRGGITHGWFKDNELISKVRLHHKYVYLRFGGEHAFRMEYSLQHFAQWGGTSSTYGKLPSDLGSFVKVFFGQGGGSNAPSNETINAFGNHVGSHHFALEYRSASFTGKFYWQNLFEDRSGMRLKNFPDGLWGITMSFPDFKILSRITAEVIYTYDQSGSASVHIIDSLVHDGTGADNYFNNGPYGSGWTNRGMTLGNPLITSPVLFDKKPGIFIENNRLIGFHLGIGGRSGKFQYSCRYTFTRNFGLMVYPFPSELNEHHFIMNTSIEGFLPWKLSAGVALAVDHGDFLGDQAGVGIFIRKEGLLSF